jgi:hypothetical protein
MHQQQACQRPSSRCETGPVCGRYLEVPITADPWHCGGTSRYRRCKLVFVRWIGALLLLAGCRQLLGFEGVAPTDGGLDPDTLVIPDAAVCTELSTTCVEGVVLRQCTSIGELPVDTTCSWGCLDDSEGPRCGLILPAANVLSLADLNDSPGLLDVTINANTTINTDTGEIAGVRAPGAGVVSGIEYKQLNNTGVFRMRSLTINATLDAKGQRGLAIAALGDVLIANLIDLRDDCAGNNGGPGAGDGGSSGNNGQGPGGGERGEGAGPEETGGGGGGGNGEVGAKGGDGQSGATGGVGGSATGSPVIAILIGGSGGGGGARSGDGGPGGGGGGALHLVSNTRIEITSGGINAGGCGGKRGTVLRGAGGGGGAGGTLLLEAPTISITNAALAVNGGGGGAGGVSSDGTPGLLQQQAAAGGTAAGALDGDGGGGGATATPASPGGSASHSGGGGGGVGRIRLHTRSGTATVGVSGFTSPALGEPAATQGTATIR